MRRLDYEGVGGFPDWFIAGGADHFMSYAMVNQMHIFKMSSVSDQCMARNKVWQARALDFIDGSVGFINGDIHHLWHGAERNRGYGTRHNILHGFNPDKDTYYNDDGVIQLVKDKVKMKEMVIEHFKHRSEDDE